MAQERSSQEDAILIDFAEQKIGAAEAANRLEDIGYEPVTALMLLRAWEEMIRENGAIQ